MGWKHKRIIIRTFDNSFDINKPLWASIPAKVKGLWAIHPEFVPIPYRSERRSQTKKLYSITHIPTGFSAGFMTIGNAYKACKEFDKLNWDNIDGLNKPKETFDYQRYREIKDKYSY